jgi:microcystin-dependent protein
MANRPGFLIKNAGETAGNYGISAPDAVDFLLLGSSRYGVVAGCDIEIPVGSAATATVYGGSEGNVLLVKGELHFAANQVVSLFTGSSARDRFDLLVYDGIHRDFRVLRGPVSSNPVFPDVGENMVVLLSMLVPAGATSINRDYTTDKRILVPSSFKGSVAPSAVLLSNTLSSGEKFRIEGSGKLSWGDVSLQRSDIQTLRVDGYLTVTQAMTLPGLTVNGDITATGLITGSNIRRGPNTPTGGEGNIGDIYVRESDGAFFSKRSYGGGPAGGDPGWVEYYADEYPPGTIISSILAPGDAYLGSSWLPMDGGTYARSAVGRLWDVPGAAAWRNLGTETMTIPNMADRLPVMGAGALGAVGGSMDRTLTQGQLPAHTHFGGGSSSTGSGGEHTHVANLTAAGGHGHNVSGGGHGHNVIDPGHEHVPQAFGTNFITGIFDNTKPNVYPDLGPNVPLSFRVTFQQYTDKRTTGISVTGGDHGHAVENAGEHTHQIVFQQSGGHTHNFPAESPVGGSQPVSVRPAYLGVNMFIKI